MNHSTANLADRNLVNQVLAGDTRAFGVIIRHTESLVTQIVFKMIPVAEDRKDLAQDIYLKAFQHLGGFKFQSKLSTWIAQIGYNTCLSWLEKKRLLLPGQLEDKAEKNFDSGYDPETGNESEIRLFSRELTRILQREITQLSPLYQTLITLFHQESQSYQELSLITGLPEGTVKSYLFRARRMLKENLLSKYKKEAL